MGEAESWSVSGAEFRKLASTYSDFASVRDRSSSGAYVWQSLCPSSAVREDFNVAATRAALIGGVPDAMDPVFHWHELLSSSGRDIPRVLAASAEYCADQEQLALRNAAQPASTVEGDSAVKQNTAPKFFDVATDPCDENPFPVRDVRHGIWQRATRRVEEELSQMTGFLTEAYKVRAENERKRVMDEIITYGRPLGVISMAPVLVPIYQLKFDSWAWRGLAAIAGDDDLPIYDSWLVKYAQSWIELIEGRDQPEVVKRPLVDALQTALQGRIGHWKSEARKHCRSQFEASKDGEGQSPPPWETRVAEVGRLPDDGVRPGAPLLENFPDDDPRHSALVPFFEVMEKFQLLADEYPTLSIGWWAKNGSWIPWPPPSRAVGEGENHPSSPGSDLHIKTSAGDAARRLLPSPESWFNPARDPWLDLKDKEPWEVWFYAMREFWLNAREEAEDAGADVGEFATVAEAVGYVPTHSAQAIKERHWRKMVKSKTPYSEQKPSTADEIHWQAEEEVGGWLQRGGIQSAFRACAYFCGVLAACKVKNVSGTEESISDVVTRPDLDEANRAAARAAWLNQKLIEKRWTADTDIAANGGPSYNTVQRYRSGKRSTRDPSVRLGLATAFGCEFSSVPD
jgi:hypothetical protein